MGKLKCELYNDNFQNFKGKEFQAFTDKNGKTWSAGQVFHMSESNNTDGKARCSSCMKKAGTQKQKG